MLLVWITNIHIFINKCIFATSIFCLINNYLSYLTFIFTIVFFKFCKLLASG